jgi:hypothetical protein
MGRVEGSTAAAWPMEEQIRGIYCTTVAFCQPLNSTHVIRLGMKWGGGLPPLVGGALWASPLGFLDFEKARFQEFETSRETIRGLKAPLMDSVIEIMCLHNLAYPKRKKSIQNEAEVAVQDIRKVAAALRAQPEYYPSAPFAQRGYMLLFDNSHLVPDVDIEPVREEFQRMLCDGLRSRSLVCREAVNGGFTIEALPLRIIASYAAPS